MRKGQRRNGEYFMRRYQYLDVARGLGLLLVIISHSCGLSRFLINYYIPLFFVVSGYIYKEGRSYRENITHKAKRLLIPYFGYSAVLLAVYALMGRTFAETKASAFGILYSRYCLYDTTVVPNNVYLFTVANGAMWYLTAFFATSLVYHVVIDRCLADKKFLIGTLVVLTVITMALADIPVLLPWSIDLVCVGTIFMIAGTLLGRAQFFEKKWNIPLIAAVLAIYILTSCLDPGINMSIREYGVYGAVSVPFFIIVGLTGSLLCIWFGKLIENTAPGKFIAYVGKNTIFLLAFHIFALEVIERIASKFIAIPAPGGPIVPFVLYHALRIAAAVLGCLAVSALIEKTKKMLSQKRRPC